MKKPLILAGFVLILAGLAAAQKDWVGTYTFDEDGGRNAGGTAIFIAHQLMIMESDDGLIAHLESNGYQTSKDLNCKAKVNGNKLEIYFDNYGENNVFESYEKGELLLTLEKKTIKSKPQIVTHWGKFTPVVPEKPVSGKVFFVRSK